MPTFGDTTIEAGTFTGQVDQKRAYRSVLTEDGVVSSVSIYMTGGTSAQVYKAVIYGDTAGAPGALLWTSAEQTCGVSQAAGWVVISVSPGLSLTAGTYYLGFIAGTVTGWMTLQWVAGAGTNQYWSTDTYSDGATDPFGTPTGSDSTNISIYATYAASAVPLSRVAMAPYLPN